MPFTVGQYLTANDLKSQEDAHTLGYGVVNGLKVIPTDPVSMTVQVEIGKAYAADTLVEKGAVTDLVVSVADPTNPRKDIVVCNSAGTLSIVAGTPEAALPSSNVGVYTLNPEPPSIPANSIILAEIWVPAGATEITGSEIYDKRVSIADFLTHKGDASAHHTKYTNTEAIAAGKTDSGLLNPSGMIILWHGTIASIPSGWVICDGNSGTPNLLTKFVQGVATAATNPGATGGATSKTTAGHTHTGPNHRHSSASHTHTIPSHTHTGPSHTHTSAAHTHSIPSHTHTGPSHTHPTSGHVLTIAEMPSHTHAALRSVAAGTGYYASGSRIAELTSGAIGGGGSHAHGNTGAGGTGATGAWSGTSGSTKPADTGYGGTGATGAWSGTSGSTKPGNTGYGGTGATGSKTDSISDIRPKYYDVAFLMKT